MDEGKNLLNSGLFIGYARELYRALNNFPFHPELENDQRFFYRLYINSTKREELVIKLDHRSQLFQTIDGGLNNIDIVYEGEKFQMILIKVRLAIFFSRNFRSEACNP